MSFNTTSNFIHKYGWGKFVQFVQMINDQLPLKEIAEELGISTAQVCRYRKKLFHPRFVPLEGTSDAMKLYADKDRLNFETKQRFINQNSGSILEFKQQAK